MPRSFATHLMFEGNAEEALELYSRVFPELKTDSIDRYGAGEAGAEGSVRRADIRLGQQRLIFIDSPIAHEFTFTPSVSVFVECATEAELNEAFAALAHDGAVLMPVGNYGFSEMFGWCQDRFGVSWQLNLEA